VSDYEIRISSSICKKEEVNNESSFVLLREGLHFCVKLFVLSSQIIFLFICFISPRCSRSPRLLSSSLASLFLHLLKNLSSLRIFRLSLPRTISNPCLSRPWTPKSRRWEDAIAAAILTTTEDVAPTTDSRCSSTILITTSSCPTLPLRMRA